MASKDDVTGSLYVLSAAYPNFQLRLETIEVYVRLLLDLETEALQAAVLQHVAESRFFPTVAELRDLAVSLTRGEHQAAGALEAWHAVMAEVRRGVGHPQVYKETGITDPKTLRAVASVGGWQVLATSSHRDDIAHRARFVEAYNVLGHRERWAARLLPEVREKIEQVARLRGRVYPALPPDPGARDGTRGKPPALLDSQADTPANVEDGDAFEGAFEII